MKSVLKPYVKPVLMPLGLTVAALESDAAIQNKMFDLGMTALII